VTAADIAGTPKGLIPGENLENVILANWDQ
jgi:hypothetical protein